MGPIPPWLKEPKLAEDLGPYYRDHIIARTSLAFYKEYEANEFGEEDPDWKGAGPRSVQDVTTELIFLANIALWLAKDSLINFEFVVHTEKLSGGWMPKQWLKIDPVQMAESETANILGAEDIRVAKEIHASIVRLDRKGALWIAVRLLSTALRERLWETRFLLYWIALESLFGPVNQKRITYQLSHRIGFFLASECQNAQTIVCQAKEGYKLRSDIVHGMHLGKLTLQEETRLEMETEDLVRRAFVKIITDPELAQKFSGKDRDQYLDSLPFQPLPIVKTQESLDT